MTLPTSSYCDSCGLPAQTKRVHFYQNIGMLVRRSYAEVQGDLCKSCIDRFFWNMTGTTMLLGWWGVISLILAPFMILNNTLRWLGTLTMPRPPIQTSKGPSPFWVFSTIAGFLVLGYFAIASLSLLFTTPPADSPTSIPRQERCAVALIGFNTFILLQGPGAQQGCDDFVANDRDLYRISLSPPTTPIICRETIEGIQATVVDTSSDGTGGALVCQSLYEAISE